jgi:hypothetical protein
MDTYPTNFPKRKDLMPNVLPQNKHVTKERGIKCENGWDHKSIRGGEHGGRN